MRETTFLKQNEKKWKEFEQVVGAREGTVPPDQIADLFIEITDDLAYARTHYPQSNTVRYLNSLAARVHLAIIKNKKEKKNTFVDFWKRDLPLLLAESQPKLFYAFLIFAIAIFIGIISTLYDINFLRMIVGDGYVDMTIDNIERGEPLAVYGTGGKLESFLSITANNLRVDLMSFIGGLLISFGTAYILLYNGIMIGAFFTFLYSYGYLGETFQVVFIHGALELSAIVISGAAGFWLGNSILFPRTYSRLESLKRGAINGLKIFLSVIPVTIVAGFLEGFVTRYTNMPALLSLLIIFASLGLIVWYYIIYPLQLKSRENSEAAVAYG